MLQKTGFEKAQYSGVIIGMDPELGLHPEVRDVAEHRPHRKGSPVEMIVLSVNHDCKTVISILAGRGYKTPRIPLPIAPLRY